VVFTLMSSLLQPARMDGMHADGNVKLIVLLHCVSNLEGVWGFLHNLLLMKSLVTLITLMLRKIILNYQDGC
jgi:hypothetical protein